MDFKQYKELVNNLTAGKQLPDAVYLHKSLIEELPTQLLKLVTIAADSFKIEQNDWNVLKLQKRNFKLSYLYYPEFESYAYPSLNKSYIIDLTKYGCRSSDYSKSKNPPILHRKETFISNKNPLHKEFCRITDEGEKIGLYDNTRSIGFKANWEKLILSKGYFLDDAGRLHPLTEKKVEHDATSEPLDIQRHKTAIARHELSAPLKILAKHGFLDGNFSLLDYGCGRGDDITELQAHGLNCIGWDPVHAPQSKKVNSDIVNLGYVLNVIEDKQERDQTLKKAWGYANKLLIVSVMVANESVIRQFTPYKDGVITKINTFQKYYSQPEIRIYIENTLKTPAIAVSQGIFIIFKDPNLEQDFLIARQQIKRKWTQLTKRERSSSHKKIGASTIEKNKELFDDFWSTILDLGRPPANDEFEFTDQLRRIARSNKQAYEATLNYYGNSIFNEAQRLRRNDLIVYFALGLFEKRRTYKNMPNNLKRDIKVFFGDYKSAINISTTALYSVGNPDLIETKAIESYNTLATGEFLNHHSWTIHRSIIPSLPVELRIYIGCAAQLYGDIDEFELVKIHFTSGKVSLMRYDDWLENTPKLIQRVKIKLRELDIDFFDYGLEYKPSPLENKSDFT